jgi:hypothetical protein
MSIVRRWSSSAIQQEEKQNIIEDRKSPCCSPFKFSYGAVHVEHHHVGGADGSVQFKLLLQPAFLLLTLLQLP